MTPDQLTPEAIARIRKLDLHDADTRDLVAGFLFRQLETQPNPTPRELAQTLAELVTAMDDLLDHAVAIIKARHAGI